MMIQARVAVLATFFNTTTLHGLLQIWESKSRSQRLVFLTAVILSNCMSVYYCIQIVRQYQDHPVGTYYVVEQNDTLILPDVTICPFGRFSMSYMKDHKIADDLVLYIETAFFLVSPLYDRQFFDVIAELKSQVRKSPAMELRLTETLQRLNLTFEQFLNQASMKCTDIIVECVNGAQGHLGFFNCCKSANAILTNMGRCFKLLPMKNRHNKLMTNVQSGSGWGQGIFVKIRLPVTNFAPTGNVAMNDGVLVKLSEHSKGFDFDAIFVPSGTHALLQLRATQLDFINDPPRFRCLEEVPPDYSPLLCYQQCLLEPLESTCECRYAGVQRPEQSGPSKPVCRPAQILTCGYWALSNATRVRANYSSDCRSRCQGRCRYWQYHPTVSYANFPTENDMLFSDDRFEGFNEANVSRWRETEIILEIFFEKLEYTKIKHFPTMTLYNFVANLGGQAGLWMGGSILSIVHLIVFLFMFICTCDNSKPPEPSDSQQPFLTESTSKIEMTTSL